MIKVNLHGKLGKDLGESWDLDVSTVAEALRAIEANTRKLRKWMIESIEECEYEILINQTNLFSSKPNFKSQQEILNSEFFINIKDKIEVIDVVPHIKGAGPVVKFIVGVVTVAAAVVVGIIFPPLLPLAIGIGLAGLGLIAAGTSELLSKPPPSVPFVAQQTDPLKQEEASSGLISYLFNGPINTVGEGGPVPIGYGTLLIGGNNVFANYDIIYRTYKSKISATEQEELSGDDMFLFDSRCSLINQEPLTRSPY